MSLVMSLRGRGAGGSAARTAKVLSRFGATPTAMAARLDRYRSLVASFGARPTWPATACVLARHPDLLRRYAESGAELAVHGLVHGDHAVLDRPTQRNTIARALDIFERAGLQPVGFRGPYLRYNDATLAVLRELGFRYDSSQAFAFPRCDGSGNALPRNRSYELAMELYAARDADRLAVRPRLRGGLVDLPVAIPDDEIIIERLRLDEAAATGEWSRIFELSYARGDLFTIQLHPERIYELETTLRQTLRIAASRRPGVFIAGLDQIAEWWRRRDRFRLTVLRTSTGCVRVHLDADRDATLVVRGLAVDGAAPWSGGDMVVVERRSFEAAAERLPIVGVSRRTPAQVGAFLAEEGFACEVSDEPRCFGAYVDVSDTRWSETALLESITRSPGPLVRLWRWPNGARSALAVTGDIDALTLKDFVLRSWETRRSAFGRSSS
jgi:peptidoglycan/xylan/chitin deacetylase (PgdA/CDA1 family)